MTLQKFLYEAQLQKLRTVEEALWIIFPGDDIIEELQKYPSIAPFTPIDAAIEEINLQEEDDTYV